MTELQVVTDNKTVASIDYKAKAMEYLTSMGSNLPKPQQAQFLELAQEFQLNPFKREIYAVGYADKWNIITGYEVYLKRAERCGKLDGWKVTVDGSGESLTATVTIYRKDWKMPFEHTVLFSECAQKTKEGKLNSIWSKMPSFMLKKVAVAQGFRLCFPDEFSGMPYIADEMPSEEQMKEINITPKENPKTEKKIVPEKKKALYTQAQVDEIASILDTINEDGIRLFNENEKNGFREMLKHDGGEVTLNAVKEMLKLKLSNEQQ